jgi:hypothetical protein
MKARKSRKQRATRHGSTPPRTDPTWESDEFQVGAASLALRHLALRRARGHSLMVDAEVQFAQYADRHQQLAFDDQLAASVRGLFAHGWTPLDLFEATRRKVDAAITEHLMCVVAQQTAGHGAVHPEWRAQIAAFSTTVDGGSRAWTTRTGLPWHVAREQLLDLLVQLLSMPVIETVLPAPGTPASAMSAATSRVDERVLRKVRALLAKAESTEYEDEADALTAKAQQLMTAHSIERALAEGAQQVRSHPVVRRIWLDAPYLTAKSMVIDAVARSNSCYSILSKAWGFVTLVGHSADLDTTELLSTSLLVQATRAMTAAGSQTSRYGTSRTRSFRQSFLVAYAGRIGERLAEASTQAQTTADAEQGGTLLPVLAARADEVRDAADALFPEVKQTRVHVGDRAGWGAGRAAADLARFDVRDALDERAG